MKSTESKGKTVDEAIFNGLRELDLDIDEVEIEILHEGSKGLFGITKNAEVRLTQKETGVRPMAATVEGGAAEAFLNELFNKMNVGATCKQTEQTDKGIKIVIDGDNTAVLIGRRGDTLDALQYLTGLVINRGKEGYVKVMLDAENYREKREATLQKLAKRLANDVAKYGKSKTLEPMNPYERRILHATLQNNPRVETYSEGEEPYRRVIIRRKRQERNAE